MSKVAISKFKAQCLELITKLRENDPLIITKRGKAIARVMPIRENKETLFGKFKGQVEIKGDIISSIEDEWEATK